MLDREYGIFIYTINNKLPLQQTPTELAWKHALQYSMLPQEQQEHATKHLNKLHMYNIITITQIPNVTTQQLLSTLEFETKLKVPRTNQRSLTISTHTNPPHHQLHPYHKHKHISCPPITQCAKTDGEPKPLRFPTYANGTPHQPPLNG